MCIYMEMHGAGLVNEGNKSGVVRVVHVVFEIKI